VADDARLHVVVPVYGNEATLDELHERLVAALADHVDELLVTFVDDRSPDDSWTVIRALAGGTVRGLRHDHTAGQSAAICTGIDDRRDVDLVCTLDADLEIPPEDVLTLLRARRDGHDLVGARRPRQARTPMRRIASTVARPVLRAASRLPTKDPGCGVLLMDAAIATQVVDDTHGTPAPLPRLVFWRAAARPAEVPVRWNQRGAPSGFSTDRLVRLFGDVLVAEAAPRSGLARRRARARADGRPLVVERAP
jgi:glycosyltransferase involved in cell wall biosynthesis